MTDWREASSDRWSWGPAPFGWNIPAILRFAALVLLGPFVLIGVAWTLTFSVLSFVVGLPLLLMTAPALVRVLRAQHVRRGHPATVVLVAAIAQIWSAVYLLRESNPWDNDVGRILLVVGIFTLALGMAIRWFSDRRDADAPMPVGG